MSYLPPGRDDDVDLHADQLLLVSNIPRGEASCVEFRGRGHLGISPVRPLIAVARCRLHGKVCALL